MILAIWRKNIFSESTSGVRDYPMRNGYYVSTPAFTAINANNFDSEDYQGKQNRKGKVMQLLEIST